MTRRVGIVRFPGTTAESEAVEAVRTLGAEAVILWHADPVIDGVDALVLPGGAAHGDALRPGAIAARAPIMDAVRRFADAGGPVLGVGNGFQILTEAGLLPGAFLPNRDGRFLATTVTVRVETANSPITAGIEPGTLLSIPIAHGVGRHHVDPDERADLEADDRILLRYVDNPNGSVADIAGVLGPTRNVAGVMVRPERAISPLLGSDDGLRLLSPLLGPASVASAP